MWNVLLDELPKEWNGYPIDFDFQTGIQINQCLADDDLSETERFYTARDLLFPDTEHQPDVKESAKALEWFMSEFHHDNNTNQESGVTVMDFDIDQWRIYAAFMNQYHIDLNTAEMHWFTFMGLLSNLNECAFTNVMNIRGKKITSKMSAEEKNAIRESKKVFEIKPPKEAPLSETEKKEVDEFMKYANINKKEP